MLLWVVKSNFWLRVLEVHILNSVFSNFHGDLSTRTETVALKRNNLSFIIAVIRTLAKTSRLPPQESVKAFTSHQSIEGFQPIIMNTYQF